MTSMARPGRKPEDAGHQPARGGDNRDREREARRPSAEGRAGERSGCRGAGAQGRIERRTGAGEEAGQEEASRSCPEGSKGKVVQEYVTPVNGESFAETVLPSS